jgi:hypothetical protein
LGNWDVELLKAKNGHAFKRVTGMWAPMQSADTAHRFQYWNNQEMVLLT